MRDVALGQMSVLVPCEWLSRTDALKIWAEDLVHTLTNTDLTLQFTV